MQVTAYSRGRWSLREEVTFGNLTANNCCGIHLECFFFLHTFPYIPCNAQPALVPAEVNIPWCFQNIGQNYVNRMQLNRLYMVKYTPCCISNCFCSVLFCLTMMFRLTLNSKSSCLSFKTKKGKEIWYTSCCIPPHLPSHYNPLTCLFVLTHRILYPKLPFLLWSWLCSLQLSSSGISGIYHHH